MEISNLVRWSTMPDKVEFFSCVWTHRRNFPYDDLSIHRFRVTSHSDHRAMDIGYRETFSHVLDFYYTCLRERWNQNGIGSRLESRFYYVTTARRLELLVAVVLSYIERSRQSGVVGLEHASLWSRTMKHYRFQKFLINSNSLPANKWALLLMNHPHTSTLALKL